MLLNVSSWFEVRGRLREEHLYWSLKWNKYAAKSFPCASLPSTLTKTHNGSLVHDNSCKMVARADRPHFEGAVRPIAAIVNWSYRFLQLTGMAYLCTARRIWYEWHRHEKLEAFALIIHHLKGYSDISLLIFLLFKCQKSVRLVNR